MKRWTTNILVIASTVTLICIFWVTNCRAEYFEIWKIKNEENIPENRSFIPNFVEMLNRVRRQFPRYQTSYPGSPPPSEPPSIGEHPADAQLPQDWTSDGRPPEMEEQPFSEMTSSSVGMSHRVKGHFPRYQTSYPGDPPPPEPPSIGEHPADAQPPQDFTSDLRPPEMEEQPSSEMPSSSVGMSHRVKGQFPRYQTSYPGDPPPPEPPSKGEHPADAQPPQDWTSDERLSEMEGQPPLEMPYLGESLQRKYFMRTFKPRLLSSSSPGLISTGQSLSTRINFPTGSFPSDEPQFQRFLNKPFKPRRPQLPFRKALHRGRSFLKQRQIQIRTTRNTASPPAVELTVAVGFWYTGTPPVTKYYFPNQTLPPDIQPQGLK